MQIIPLKPGDRLSLKKPHPCGGDVFSVIRVGADVRVVCETCKRDMTLDRIKLERSVRRVLSPAQENENEKGTTQT